MTASITEPVQVYLSLGSNQAPGQHLRAALVALRDHFGKLDVSKAYRSASVGFTGADFVNLAVGLRTTLEPAALNHWLHALEDAQGRQRDSPRYADRTLDVDLVFYGQLIRKALKLPRPELQYAFVLRPLLDIAAEFHEPCSGETLAALWSASPTKHEALDEVDLAKLD